MCPRSQLGSNRAKTELALSVLKTLFFPILRFLLLGGCPSGSLANVYPFLHPDSLFKQALGGLSLSGQGQVLSPAGGPCHGWSALASGPLEPHQNSSTAPSSPQSLGSEGREARSQGWREKDERAQRGRDGAPMKGFKNP